MRENPPHSPHGEVDPWSWAELQPAFQLAPHPRLWPDVKRALAPCTQCRSTDSMYYRHGAGDGQARLWCEDCGWVAMRGHR